MPEAPGNTKKISTRYEGGYFSVSKNLSARCETVQKGARLAKLNPKAYVYTPRGEVWTKQAKNSLKLDVSRSFTTYVLTWIKAFV